MPDMEKVIKGLEGMIDYFFDIFRNDTDSYKCAKAQEYSDCAIDAIALLKEQEAKLPRKITKIGGLMNGICPNPLCNAEINNVSNGMACGYCGQAVKWE